VQTVRKLNATLSTAARRAKFRDFFCSARLQSGGVHIHPDMAGICAHRTAGVDVDRSLRSGLWRSQLGDFGHSKGRSWKGEKTREGHFAPLSTATSRANAPFNLRGLRRPRQAFENGARVACRGWASARTVPRTIRRRVPQDRGGGRERCLVRTSATPRLVRRDQKIEQNSVLRRS
jgi:hypothetical protein